MSQAPQIAIPEVCPGCATEHKGDRTKGGAKWLAWAGFTAAMAAGCLPTGCVAYVDPVAQVTYFAAGGVRKASGGRSWEGGLEELERKFREHAALLILKKGARGADYYTDCLTRSGRRRYQDATGWATLTLDADGIPGGDWGALRDRFEAAGQAAIFNRSSSHTPEAPKWHALIPFAEVVPLDLSGEEAQEEWSRQVAWAQGYFSALAGFTGVGKDYEPQGKDTPACGFDLKSKSGGPGQPVYLPARRCKGQPPPEVFRLTGGALDFLRFLELTGYHEARTLWLEQEAQRPARVPRERSSGGAGASGATLRDLPEHAQDEARGWASRWASSYAACGDRQAGALAIGGYLGRRGIGERVACGLVSELARRGGVAGDRGRAASDSAANALAGVKTYGLPQVRKLLGDGAARELQALADLIAPDTKPRRRLPVLLEAPEDARKTTRGERREWLRAAMAAPAGSVHVDAGPTGSGKTTGTAQAVGELDLEADPRRVLIATPDHRMATEWERRLAAAGASHARMPKLVGPDYVPQKGEPPGSWEPCLAGKVEEIQAVVGRGWPAWAVCGSCPYVPTKGFDAPGAVKLDQREREIHPCPYRLAQKRALSADVQALVAQQQSVGSPAWWEGDGRRWPRVVVDEELARCCIRDIRLGARELERWGEVLHIAQVEVRGAAEQLPPGSEVRAEAQRSAAPLLAALELGEALTAAAARVLKLSGKPGDLLVIERGAVEQEGDLRPQLRAKGLAGALLSAALDRARADNLEAKHPVDTNHLPWLLEVARQLDDRGEWCAVRARSKGEEPPALCCQIATRIPERFSLLCLDATADLDVVRAVTGAREPAVLRGGPHEPPPVVQIADRMWSRRRLGIAGGGLPKAEAVGQLADQLAEAVRLKGARSIGLVSYKPLLDPEAGEPLLAALRERVGELEVRRLWFGGLRGDNRFAPSEEGENNRAGVDLVLVVGTPSPAPEQVVQRALLVRGRAADLQEKQSQQQLEGWPVPVFTFPPGPMRDAHLALAGAELTQAIGRGARGEWSPPCGTWVWSSAPWPRSGEVYMSTFDAIAAGQGGHKSKNARQQALLDGTPRGCLRATLDLQLVALLRHFETTRRLGDRLGVSHAAVAFWLKGERVPRREQAQVIRTAFDQLPALEQLRAMVGPQRPRWLRRAVERARSLRSFCRWAGRVPRGDGYRPTSDALALGRLRGLPGPEGPTRVAALLCVAQACEERRARMSEIGLG